MPIAYCPKTREAVLNRIALAVLAVAVAFAGAANAQGVDFSKVEIKTNDRGNKTYRLEGQGGNITVAVGTDGIIMVDGQFAPLHDKIKAAITAISPLPIKYLINTHFHGDHTGGNESFQNDGAIVVAQDNVRVRLAAGTTNGITGAKTPPVPAGALPKQTYIGGSITLEVGGRTAQLTHVNNAHTDGDTWVYFADANVLCTGDTMNNTKRYQTIDFANGGDIRGMIRATDTYLKVANDETRVMTGHGTLAKEVRILPSSMRCSRPRVTASKKLFKRGTRTEADVVAARPLKDLDAKWAANDEATVNCVLKDGLQLVQSLVTIGH